MPDRRVPNNLDPYLYFSFHMDREADGDEDVGAEAMLPFLVRVYDPGWRPADPIAHFVVDGRLGVVLTARGDRRSVERLLDDPGVHSVEASRPLGPAALECDFSVPDVRASKVHAVPLLETGERSIVAIVDDGVDVLHEAFLDATGTKTRIRCVWDQTDRSGSPPKGWTYGTLYIRKDIDRCIAGAALPPGSKLAEYHRKGGADGAHGTLVASVAAGRRAGTGPPFDFAGGVAPQAEIIVVVPNLEVVKGDKQRMGYSKSHLDALVFIDQEAGAEPVVVNVSMGMNTGGHDGAASVEVGYDEFTNGGLKPGRAVVKSAGNQAGRSGHAVLHMHSLGTDSFQWDSGYAARDEDLVELWFRACDEHEFRLHPPKGSPTPWASRAAPLASHVFGHTPNKAEMAFQRYCADNGDGRLLVRISREHASGIEVGPWRLEVKSGAVVHDGRIDAWLERRERGATNFTKHVVDACTVTVPGTARTVISVGAAERGWHALPESSRGPTRDGRPKPTLVAPGRSIHAAAKGRGTAADAQSGTSMAAPHTAGAVALLFSRRAAQCARDPSLRQWNVAQIQKAISHMCQGFNGAWSVDTGYGYLDVEAFLDTFDR